MIAINPNVVLVLLAAFSVIYALWVMCYLISEKRQGKAKSKTEQNGAPRTEVKKRGENIVGKSLFVLSERHSQTQAASETENEKRIENQSIFVPSNVPEHPRIIPRDELDEAFGQIPPGEKNDPLEIDYPLSYDDQPEEAEPDEYEEVTVTGGQIAEGVSFENMGEAYRTIVHNPILSEQKKEETGRVLASMQQTDMFEALVSGSPERQDKVSSLIDTYMTAFHKRKSAETGENNAPAGDVPPGFSIRDFV